MKKSSVYLTALAVLSLGACGNSAVDGELIGQVKKVSHVTPLICPDYYAVDVSMGVMRNGTGSMSTQDMWLTVADFQALAGLQKMASDGSLVKVHYNTRRAAFCTEDYILTAAEVTH
jgi:hypothetical protein